MGILAWRPGLARRSAGPAGRLPGAAGSSEEVRPVSVLRFWIFQRVRLEQNLNFEGWSSHVHGEFPGKFESTNLSRDNLSREIGRASGRAARAGAADDLRLRHPGNGRELLYYTILYYTILYYTILSHHCNLEAISETCHQIRAEAKAYAYITNSLRSSALGSPVLSCPHPPWWRWYVKIAVARESRRSSFVEGSSQPRHRSETAVSE